MKNQLEVSFMEAGYVYLPKLFQAEEITTLREDLAAASKKLDGLTQGQMLFHSNLFYHSPALQAFISQPKIIQCLTPIIGPDIFVRWDQAVNKMPGAGDFPWHQDNGYNQLKDEHFQLWIATTAMNADNGGLWVKPGSHKQGILPHYAKGNHRCCDPPSDPVLINADVGDALLFSSFLLHFTAPNTTPNSRLAYVVEYMSGNDLDPFIKSPYFHVAKNNQPDAQFRTWYRGSLNPFNHWDYFLRRLRFKFKSLTR